MSKINNETVTPDISEKRSAEPGILSGTTYWTMIFVSYVSLFFLGLLDNARAPFFPDIMHDLKLDNFKASFFFVTTSSFAFISGRLTFFVIRRMGLNNTFRLSQFVTGAGFASMAFAETFGVLLFSCAIFGFGFGSLNITQNLFVMEGASLTARRRLISGLHSMYAFSSLIAPLLASVCFRYQLTWRQAYLYFGISVLISVLISFVNKVEKVHIHEKKTVLPKHVKDRSWLIAAVLSLYVIGELTLTTRLPLYLREARGYTPEKASEYLSYVFLAMFIGRIAFTFFKWKRFTTHNIIVSSLVLSILFFIVGLLGHPFWLCISVLAMSPIYAMVLEYHVEIFKEHSSMAITNSLAVNALFIVSMHLMLGALTDVIGIQYSMYLGPVFLMISTLLVMLDKKYIIR
jgi:FHS family glucose/mannose:H+ symporter-like MFS transporter